MLNFLVMALTVQSLLGQYVNIESQSFSELIDRGDINLSISLRNSDASIDIKTGVKVSFEIIPSSSYEVGSQGKWEYDTTDGIVDNISINQNCQIAFVVVVKAVGYTSATSSSFERFSNSCTNKLIIESPSSVHILQPFLVNIQLNNIEIPNQLYIKELGNNLISDIMSLSDITLNYSFEIYFDTPGTKYLYAIYNDYLINSVTIEVSYCILEVFHTLEDTNTVFKAFTIQVQFNNDDGMCEFCIGKVTLYTSPTIIVDGDSSSSVESLTTNCEAEFNDLSVSISGDYSFIIDSDYIENSYTIGTKKFEKAKLKIAFIEDPVDVSTIFSINVQIMSFDFISVIIVAGIEINVIIEPSVAFSDNSICTTIDGKCDFSNLLIQTPGIYQLIASCNECDDDYSENFKVICYLKVELDDDKIDFSTDNEFYIWTSIYYDSGLNTLFISGQHTFIFVFSPEITKEYGNTINNGCISKAIKIPAEGTYIISASAENCFSSNSVTVNIKNYYINATMIPENSKTAYPLFGISFDTYQDVNLLTKETSIEFTIYAALNSKTKLKGVTECTTISGNCHLSGLTIATNGAYKLKASGNRLITWFDSNQIIVPCQKYLSITNLNPLPATTETIFSLEITVFTTLDLTTQDIGNFYNIMISITSDTYSEIKSATTNNGLVQFNDLIILAEGTFKITTYTINAFYSEKTDIIIENYYIMIAPSPETPFKNYTFFAFCIQLYENIGLQTLSSNNFELTIEFTPNINIQNPFNAVFAGGFLELNDLIATTDDIYTIKVSGLKFITKSYTFEVETCYLDIEFYTNEVLYTKPTYPKNIFNVLVKIYRKEHELSTKSWEIFLDLEPNGKLTGAKSATTNTGSILIDKLSIENIGTYRLKASGLDLLDGFSEEISISYCYLKISIVGKQPFTTESSFSIRIEVFSDINLINLAEDFADLITIYLDPIGDLQGESTKNCTFITVFENLTILSENNYSVLAESNFAHVSIEEIIEIKNYYLNFTFTSAIPVNTESIFSGEVFIFEDPEMKQVCIECLFTIQLSIDNDGVLFGNSSILASNGNAEFSDLQITTEGNYAIYAKSEKAISNTSEQFTIKNYYILLDLVSNYPVITRQTLHTKSYFSLEISIYDSKKYNKIYTTGSYLVSIKIVPYTKIENNSQNYTYNGKGTLLNFLIPKIGSYNLTAYGDGLISDQLSLTILDSKFSWSFTLEHPNNIIIQFEKSLSSSITIEDFSIKCEKGKNIEYVLEANDTQYYYITAIAKETIPKNTEISIQLIKQDVISEDGFYFDNSVLYVKLNYVFIDFSMMYYAQFIANYSSTTAKVAASTNIAAALVKSPSFMWSFMNSMDVIAYLPLNSITYPGGLVLYFSTLGSLNLLPNPATYLFSISNTSEPYLEARRFGFETSYFLYNNGILTAYFLVYVSLIPIFFIGSRIFKNSIGLKCSNYLKNYKYGFFLRFWLQSYINIGILSIIQIRSEFPESIAGIFNMVLACISALMFFLTPTLLFIHGYVSYKNNLLVDYEFNQKWGSLYEEFKNDCGFLSTQFYTVFTLRRIVFVLSQILLNSMLYIQNAVNIFASILQLLFLFVYRPYKSRPVLLSSIIEESSVLTILIISFFFIYNISVSVKRILEAVIIFIIAGIISMSTIFSIFLLVQAIKELWVKFKERRNINYLQALESKPKVYPEEYVISSIESHKQLFRKRTSKIS